jgi:hypothetical protein
VNLAGKNLLDGPEPTYLTEEPGLTERIEAGDEAEDLAARFPKAPLAWALCAEDALAEGRTLEGYAFARVGYHRGLDALRGHGWKGHGPVPFSHVPNQGFLRALACLGRAAAAIGEFDEAERIQKFLNDSDPTAAEQLRR